MTRCERKLGHCPFIAKLVNNLKEVCLSLMKHCYWRIEVKSVINPKQLSLYCNSVL